MRERAEANPIKVNNPATIHGGNGWIVKEKICQHVRGLGESAVEKIHARGN